jgi:hypothetical protein
MEQLIPLLMVFALGYGVGYGVRELKSQRRRGRPLNKVPSVVVSEIRKRAERRLGQLMALMPKAKPVNPKPSKDRRVADRPNDRVPTLDDRGIDKHLADRRKAAAKSAASSAPRPSFDVRPPGARPRRGGGHG